MSQVTDLTYCPIIDANRRAVFVAPMFIIIGGDGKEYGPVTVDQIRTWITAGRANLDTQAKLADAEEWRRLGDFAEFSGAPVPPLVGQPGAKPPDAGTLQAARGARIGAALINAFGYFFCMMPGSMMISRKLMQQNPELAQGGFPRLSELDLTPVRDNAVWVLAGLGAGFALQAILIALRGQNIGKLIVGARVVRFDNEQPAGFLRGAILRFIIPVTVMLCLHYTTGLLGILLLLVDFCFIFRADGRCLHDLIAGTKVVKA